jgi:hypothetical protein
MDNGLPEYLSGVAENTYKNTPFRWRLIASRSASR